MILWMAGIFVFSSRSGDESAEDSYFVGTMVGDFFVPGFDEWSTEKQQEFAGKIDHPVRKTAHAAEYAVLGLLAAGVCIPSTVSRRDEKAMPACLSEDSVCPGRIFHQQGNGSISGRNLDEKQIKNCAGRKLICHGKDLRT